MSRILFVLLCSHFYQNVCDGMHGNFEETILQLCISWNKFRKLLEEGIPSLSVLEASMLNCIPAQMMTPAGMEVKEGNPKQTLSDETDGISSVVQTLKLLLVAFAASQ